MRAKAAWAAYLAAASALIAGCSASSSGTHQGVNDCDRDCQVDLAAADGKKIPPGAAFDFDTSKCSLWTREPSSVRYTLASVYATRLGAGDSPKASLVMTFEKTITISCKSYPNETVKHVAKLLRNLDTEWPNG